MNNDITIEGNIATWTMPPTVGELGGTYTGTFSFRTWLDPIRQLQAGREFRELLGNLGHQASETEYSLAYALTQLKHRVLTSPPFWTSTTPESGMAGNVGDLNILMAVLDSATRAADMFKERIAKERESLLERSIKTAEETLHRASGEA